MSGMICPKCKTENLQSARFCSHCGASLRSSQNVSHSNYTGILKKMTGEKRLKTAFKLYEIAFNLTRENILENSPHLTEEELKKKILKRFGNDPGRFTGKAR
ncbi:zinc-ribbon domain-containing protein [bacterium]|nr:zinc-ribbon domain-containing protein [bacterium]